MRRLAVGLAAMLLSACAGEDVAPDSGTLDPGPPARDAGPSQDGGGGGARDGGSTEGSDAGTTCAPLLPPNGDGHSADYDCMSSGCHGPGSAVAGLLITVSGTLHSTPNGGAPVGGATVFVTDSLGQTLHLVTSAQGIFWSGVSDGGMVPAGPQGTCADGPCTTWAAPGAMTQVIASLCPSLPQACASPSSGQCAQCHSYGTGSQQSVHLP